LTNLAMEGERSQEQKANALYGQLDNQGNWQNLADDYNQRKPYAEQVAAKSDLTQAGNENIYSGLNDAAEGLLSGLKPSDVPLTGGIKGVSPKIVGPVGTNPIDDSGYGFTSPTLNPTSANNIMGNSTYLNGMPNKQLYKYLQSFGS